MISEQKITKELFNFLIINFFVVVIGTVCSKIGFSIYGIIEGGIKYLNIAKNSIEALHPAFGNTF